MTKWLNTKSISSVISTPETNQIPSQEDAAFKSCGKNQHSDLLQWLCNRTLSALEKLPCTKHTDLVKAHSVLNVSTIQRSRSTYCGSNMVNMFYRLQMNASSPNCGHFFSLFDTLPFPMGLECSIWHYVFSLHHMKCSSIGNCCPLRCIPKVLKPSPKL